MLCFPRRALLLMLCAGLLLAGAAALAAEPAVKNDAAFFTDTAVQKANQILRDIKAAHDKDVLVETFTAVPANDADKVKTQADRDRYFTAWAESRMKVNNLKDVYILICKSPPRIQVMVGPETARKAFTNANRDKLRGQLVDHFRNKQYDEGLIQAVSYVRDRLDANEPFTLPRVVARRVTDHAGFFTPAAVEQANAEVQGIYRDFRKTVTVETLKTIAPDMVDRVRKMAADRREEYFGRLVAQRMKEAGTDDLHILVFQNPRHLHLAVGADLLKKGFPEADRKKLNDQLLSDFRAKHFDQGLLDGVRFLRGRLESNLPRPFPSPVANQVKDYAHFFSTGAVQAANTRLGQLHQGSRKNVIIETFPTVERDKIQQAEAMTAEARNRYFAGWVRDRSRASGVDGIHVLICKSPGHVEIASGPETQKQTFKSADRAKLLAALNKNFGARQYDQGLGEAVELIADRIAPKKVAAAPPVPAPPSQVAAVPPAPQAPTPAGMGSAGGPSKLDTIREKAEQYRQKAVEIGEREQTVTFKWKYVFYVVGGILGLWILIGLLRAIFGGGRKQTAPPPVAQSPSGGSPAPRPSGGYQAGGYPVGGGYKPPSGGYQGGYPAGGYPPAGGPPSGGGGGGGFVSGMLGGMFGAAAGSWLYDKFAHRPERHDVIPPHPQPYSSPPPKADYAAGGGISTTGGDFDEPPQVSTSGGDFGDDAGEQVSSSGGDFGNEAAEQTAGSGGGDFGSEAPADNTGAGGDFGEDAAASDTGGGDFGASADAGGDFGGTDAGADFANSGDTGGGDFGGGDDVASAGGDTSGGDSGDF
jgi:uncharacterized membrane protein YgcG